MSTSIGNLVIDGMVEHLNKVMIEDIPSESALPRLIRGGNLQESPTDYEWIVLIEPAVKGNRVNSVGDADFGGIRRELGGVTWWKTIYEASFQYYVGSFDRQASRRLALELVSLLRRSIEFAPVGQKDDFGEGVHYIYVTDYELNETGGVGTFIWKGKVCFEVLTSVEYE